ncbi:hypothetical protein PIB30_043903 [Stylosanthes scabra]|uniref:Uncharacterized protein n=1 Tax=Stylosanthes scabra TaxID=79078 RepID=A0ABU6UEB9_9FABA|nr:hypothetical protein [Stylosanthes scabra]
MSQSGKYEKETRKWSLGEQLSRCNNDDASIPCSNRQRRFILDAMDDDQTAAAMKNDQGRPSRSNRDDKSNNDVHKAGCVVGFDGEGLWELGGHGFGFK